jgi:alpha-beta hydrolase superfamily lysophospholipase
MSRIRHRLVRWPVDDDRRMTRSRQHRFARLAVAAAIAAVCGCAPYVVPSGPTVGPPRIADDAVVPGDGVRLPMQRWLPSGPPRAIVLAIHGFNDYANGFDLPAKRLAESGIATYAYDQRGFGRTETRGRWSGTETLVSDAVAAARVLRARHPGLPLFILGESMGGAVAVLALARAEPPPVDGAILVAPAVWGRRHLSWFRLGVLDFLAHTIPWYPLTGQGLRIQASDNEAALRALRDDPLVIKQTRVDALYGLVELMGEAFDGAPALAKPTLLVYGRRDELVPAAPTADMLASIPFRAPVRVAVYDSGFHLLLRDLGASAVVDDIAAWIRDAHAPLPSKAEVPRPGWSQIRKP